MLGKSLNITAILQVYLANSLPINALINLGQVDGNILIKITSYIVKRWSERWRCRSLIAVAHLKSWTQEPLIEIWYQMKACEILRLLGCITNLSELGWLGYKQFNFIFKQEVAPFWKINKKSRKFQQTALPDKNERNHLKISWKRHRSHSLKMRCLITL